MQQPRQGSGPKGVVPGHRIRAEAGTVGWAGEL